MIRCLSFFLILLLGGCSLDPIFAPEPVSPSYPRMPPPLPPQPVQPPSPPPAPQSRLSPQPTPAAVVVLMHQAEHDRRNGALERAASRLERALRIQPGNAELWHELARTRLQQKQPGLAEELAKKSLSLAGADRRLRRRNWRLIAEARRHRGDPVGAREAERRAAGY